MKRFAPELLLAGTLSAGIFGIGAISEIENASYAHGAESVYKAYGDKAQTTAQAGRANSSELRGDIFIGLLAADIAITCIVAGASIDWSKNTANGSEQLSGRQTTSPHS